MRYAKSIIIHIEMRPDGSGGLIYPPYLDIDYDFISYTNITDTSAQVGFTCHYCYNQLNQTTRPIENRK